MNDPWGGPFLTMTYEADTEIPLPKEVIQEVFRYVGQMVNVDQPIWPDQELNTLYLVAGFEESHIQIGHTKAEADELREYYEDWPTPIPSGWFPVAHWRSGISAGCDMQLFWNGLTEGEAAFVWTEP